MAVTVEATGDGISVQRRAAGLTQQELAIRAGCSVAYVQVLERGYTPEAKSAPTFRRIVAELGRAQTEAGGTNKSP